MYYVLIPILGTDKMEKVTYSQWSDRIQMTFEHKFYVDYKETNQYVNRKYIYRDCVNSSSKFTDFQLRPNFTIAMNIVSISTPY